MSAFVAAPRPAASAPPADVATPAGLRTGRAALARALPVAVTLANAIAFFLIRPDVNDLWAARARAAAVKDGVGLTYWFDWFSGGTTPGSYSVLTPQLAALVGSELLCALSAVAVSLVATVAVRRTSHPVLAAWVVTYAAVANLWSGRVPFLFGAAIAVVAIIALRAGRTLVATVLTIASILASPVSGAFVLLGLSGTFITTRTKQWRPPIAIVAGVAAAAMIAVAVVFGTPGPQPFSGWLMLQLLGLLVLLWVAKPDDHVRTTIAWSALAVLVVFAIPNGMGSNLARFVWFCLPVVVLATTRRRPWVATLLVLPAMLAGASGTVNDLRNATLPVSSVEYYTPLADRLDRLPDLDNHRVEVVNHGAHAGYDALLDHAMLARGWETQEDSALNSALKDDPLDPVTYKLWLDNNAVAYVALPAAPVGTYPEYDLVRNRTPDYLQQIWRTDHWRLFRVADPTPIVAAPARIVAHTQSTLTVTVPCSCRVDVRVRYSKFLEARLLRPAGSVPADTPEVTATIADDGFLWTTMRTPQPGTYQLSGSLRGFLR